jgi:hypothetical protein
MACAERALLLPAVREADGTPLVADGSSCRTQVDQATGQRSLHVAELLANALRSARPGGSIGGGGDASPEWQPASTGFSHPTRMRRRTTR